MADQLITMATYKAQLDPSGFTQGADQIKQKSAEVTASVDKITESTVRATASVVAHASGFDQMLAKLNPLVAESNRYASQLNQINALEQDGYLQGSQKAILLDALNNKYKDLAGANDNASTSLSKFNAGLGLGRELLGAFGIALSVGGMVEFAKSALDAAAGVRALAAETGTSLSGFQAFRATMEESGLASDQAVTALTRLNRAIGEAEIGNKTALGAFQQLGITLHDLAGGPEAVMSQVASALQQIADTSERAQIETALFGRSGQTLEAALTGLKDPIGSLIDQQTKLGHVMSDDVVLAANKAAIELTSAWHRIEADVTPILSKLATGFADIVDAMTRVPSTANRMRSEAMEHLLQTGQSPASGVNVFGVGGSSTTSLSPSDAYPVTLSDIQKNLDDVAKANQDTADKVLDAWKEVHEAIAGFWADATKVADESDQKQAEAAQKISDDIIAYYDKVAEKIRQTSNDEEIAVQKLLNTYSTAGYGQLVVSDNPVAAEVRKFADDAKKAQEEAAKQSEEYWNRMFDNTFRSGQNFFTTLFETGRFSLKSFLDDFERMFATMLSDLATKALLKPIIMPVFESIAGVLGVSAPGTGGATGSTGGIGNLLGGLGGIFGSANGVPGIGSILSQSLLGPGLMGAGIGSLTGGGTGGSIGGALGGIAGNIFGGPLGGLIGSALGGLVGGLFNGKPSNFTADANFGSDYSLLAATGDKPNSATSGLAAQLGTAVSSAAKALESAGVKFSNTISQLQIGQRDQTRLIGSGGTLNIGAAGDVSAATAGALSYLLGGASSSDASVQQIIDKYRQAGQLTAEFATQLVTDITAVKQKATDLDNFTKTTADNVLKFTNPALEAWNTLMDAQDARMKQAAALGADIGKVQQLNFYEQLAYMNQLTDTQRGALTNLIGLAGTLATTVANAQSAAIAAVSQQISLSQQFSSAMRSAASQYASAADSLAKTRSGFLVGNLSPLSPSDQYSASRNAFQDTFGQASGGNLSALNSLSGAATTFLNQSLSFNGATAQYGQDFAYVQALLQQGQKIASASEDATTKLADLADQQVKILNDISGELKGPSPDRDLLQKQLDQLAAIGKSADDVVSGLDSQLQEIAKQSQTIQLTYDQQVKQNLATTVLTDTTATGLDALKGTVSQSTGSTTSGLDLLNNSVLLGTGLTIGAVFQSGLTGSGLDTTGVRSALDDFINALEDATARINGTTPPSAAATAVTAPVGVPIDPTFAAAIQAAVANDFSLILRTTTSSGSIAAVNSTSGAVQSDLATAFAGNNVGTPAQQAALSDAITRLSDTIDTSNGSTAASITDLKSEVAALRRFLTTAA